MRIFRILGAASVFLLFGCLATAERSSPGIEGLIGLKGTPAQPSPSKDRYFGLDEYRRNYFALGTHNSSENDQSPAGDISKFEWMFQLSLRRDLYQWPAKKNRVTFAYTNHSFWQITERSSPFRTSDHEPELFYEYDLNENATVRAGVNHQSNGEAGAFSRSWNRGFVQILNHSEGWLSDDEPGKGVAWLWSVKPWKQFQVSRSNPKIEEFIGFGELEGEIAWGHREHRPRLAVRFRNNLRFDHNRNGVEVSFSVGIREGVRFYAQYFNGYGESLLDYDDSSSRFSVGFELSRAR